MSRISGYAEDFCAKHNRMTDTELEKLRSRLEAELGELVDREECHAFLYAEMNWELDMINSMIKKKG